MKFLSVFIISAFVIAFGDSSSSVPVLLWSSKTPQGGLRQSALETLEYGKFEQHFVKDYGTQNLLLLLQDEISVEDLSTYHASFEGVQQVLNDKHQMYLPNVETPSHLVSDLSDHGYNIIKSGFSDVGQIVLKKGLKNVVVVQLPSSTSSRELSMKKSGEAMRTIIEKILKLADFNVIFTAVRNKEVKHSIRKRSVAQGKFFKTDCVLLNLKKDLVFMSQGKSHVLATDKISKVESECADRKSVVKLSYSDVQLLGAIEVQLHFVKKGSKRWTLDSAQTKTTSDNDTVMLKAPRSTVYMHVGQSFLCSSKVALVSAAGANGRASHKLVLKDAQMQAFTKGATKFSLAINNVGFFTVGIWAGLLSTLLLLSILMWGFYMLADLRTMDRFDDPKAKPLITNTQD